PKKMSESDLSRREFLAAQAVMLLARASGVETQPAASHAVASPDGRVRFTLSADRLSYDVAFGVQPVLDRSAIVVTVDGVAITRDAVVVGTERYRGNRRYRTRGSHSEATDR